jgi:hypothetical protein
MGEVMKKLMLAIVAVIAIGSCGLAHADTISGLVAGDNTLSYWNGSAWVGAGNNWPTPVTLNFDINQSSQYEYFAVTNAYTTPGSSYDGGNNPAAFLADFTDNGGTFTATGTDTILSNTANFQILAETPWIADPVVFPNVQSLSTISPTVIPTTLTGWETPTLEAVNGSGAWGSAYTSVADPNADWIWSANDTGSFATTDDYDIIRVDLGVNSVVPEPPTALLFAFAIAMFVVLNVYRRRLV